MQYQIIPPPPELAQYVKYLWRADFYSPSAHQHRINTLVDDSSGLIFQRRVERSALRLDGESIPRAFIYGQTTRPTTSECLSGFSAIGVLFHPYAAHALFGVDSCVLTDKMVPWGDFAPGEGLADRVLNADTDDEAFGEVEKFLTAAARKTNCERPLITPVIGHVRQAKGMLHVKDLVTAFGMTERKLERYFLRQMGVNPRHFIQVTRFQNVVERLRASGDERFIDIAYDLNFSDQSHFNNLIKRFSAYTPGKLRRYIADELVNVFLARE